MEETDKHWLLWDGDCGFCKRSAAWVRRRDSRGVLEISSYQTAPSPPMTPALRESCAKAVHVVTNRGIVIRAGRACLFILDQIRYRCLARLLVLPPFIWIVEPVYRLIAANRPLLSRFIFRGYEE